MVMSLSKSSCSVLAEHRDKAIHGTVFALMFQGEQELMSKAEINEDHKILLQTRSRIIGSVFTLLNCFKVFD